MSLQLLDGNRRVLRKRADSTMICFISLSIPDSGNALPCMRRRDVPVRLKIIAEHDDGREDRRIVVSGVS